MTLFRQVLGFLPAQAVPAPASFAGIHVFTRLGLRGRRRLLRLRSR